MKRRQAQAASRRRLIVISLAALALLVASMLLSLQRDGLDRTALNRAGIVLLEPPREVPELGLQDQHGQPWGVEQRLGRWHLLFFGYTYCPDICPSTLADLRLLRAELPAELAGQIRIGLVSVDPWRDTPEQLRDYLRFFDPDFLGLSGTPEQLRQLTRALSVAWIEPDRSQPDYLVDHSGQVVLIDPRGRYAGFIRPPFDAERLAPPLLEVLRSRD